MSAPATMETPSSKDMTRLLGLAVVVGIVAAIGATAFLWLVHELQTLVFSSLPDAMGYASAPWWWAAILLLIGASLVALAQRLPGHTGSGPLTGFHFDNPLQIVPSMLPSLEPTGRRMSRAKTSSSCAITTARCEHFTMSAATAVHCSATRARAR